METLKDSYRRAAYADYPQTQIKNKLATTCRMFAQNYSQQATNKDNLWVKNGFGLVMSSLAIETIFYLPNHFRQTVMVNSNNISFVKADSALLDLMNYMLKLNDAARPV